MGVHAEPQSGPSAEPVLSWHKLLGVRKVNGTGSKVPGFSKAGFLVQVIQTSWQTSELPGVGSISG